MTVRIVSEPDEKQATCPKCKRLLAYIDFDTEKDMTLDGKVGRFLECPICEQSFMVKEGI